MAHWVAFAGWPAGWLAQVQVELTLPARVDWSLWLGFGLVMSTLIVLYPLLRWAAGQAAGEAWPRWRGRFNAVYTFAFGAAVTGFVLAVLWFGWFTPPEENAAGRTEPQPQGQLRMGVNNPEQSDQRIRDEGDALQEQHGRDLDAFREDFFKGDANTQEVEQ